MERTAALSTGTKLMLASGGLLFLALFFTWQETDVKFGKRFEVTTSMDGWDAPGLVLGLLTLLLVGLVVVRHTSLELSPEVPWNVLALALGLLVFALALLKNLTDTDSAPASYVGVVLAGLLAVGAFLDLSREMPQREPKPTTWKTRTRAPSTPQPLERSGSRGAPAEPERRAAEPVKRW
jgi:hypothetical protein